MELLWEGEGGGGDTLIKITCIHSSARHLKLLNFATSNSFRAKMNQL